MNLERLKTLFADKGCSKLYVKTLSANDNSKNQVYLGGSFEVLNILPIREIYTEPRGNWEKERYKASLSFSWITDEGTIIPAKHAQLILYPKYPEVRFSGFLLGCRNAPSELMRQRLPNRLLFFAVDDYGNIFGYVTSPESEITKELQSIAQKEEHGVFQILHISESSSNRDLLLKELRRIYNLGWIESKRLDGKGNIMPCRSRNCGGYTLEAELGITPNGFSEPDYLGYEIKQFGVQSFERIDSKIITLMTPEPTHGLYRERGVEYFIRKYGYPDVSGISDRLNFGGIHKAGLKHLGTGLTLILKGFDPTTQKITDVDGKIVLLDKYDNEAASWSFNSMLKHWNKKHNLACYIPSLMRRAQKKGIQIENNLMYHYGNKAIFGKGTDFLLFLKSLHNKEVFYDPGIKMERSSTKPKIKRRSQFRIKTRNIKNLYRNCDFEQIL